jgi:hypothetical protein
MDDGNCFLDQRKSADGGTLATMEYNNGISVLQNTQKILHRAMGMLTCGVVLIHDNVHPHTAACT